MKLHVDELEYKESKNQAPRTKQKVPSVPRLTTGR